MLFFRYSVDRPHESLPELSTGYVDMAMPFLPDGKFTRAASQINAFEAAHDTSRLSSILKCQVLVPAALAFWPTSSGLRIITVLSLLRASARRDCWVAESTCALF